MSNPARQILGECVRNAIDRGGLHVITEEHHSVEGTIILLRDETTQQIVAVVDAVLPTESPFDDVVRDRLRNIAARVKAPYIICTNFRRVVSFRTEAVTAKLPDEEQIVGWQSAGDVLTLEDVRAAAQTVAITSSLRQAISWLSIDASLDAAQRSTDAAAFFAERVTQLFEDMVQCTDTSNVQRTAALRLGTSILAYMLIQVRRPTELDPLSLPYGTRSADLMLDLVGGFFRQARRVGYSMVPHRVDDVRVAPRRTDMFRMTLADLVHFLYRFDVERLSDTELHRAVDAVLQRCARVQKTSVPTIDAIDLALRATAHIRGKGLDTRMLELGPTQGLASVRQFLMRDSGACYARVYAPTADDERAVVLRSSGRLDEGTDVRILRDSRATAQPWDLVVASTTDVHDRHRIRLLLERMPMATGGVVVLFLPLSALHDAEYAAMRQALTDRFSVQWAIVSDAEALAEPDTGACCVIASCRADDTEQTLARFVYLRRPIAAFFPTSRASRDLEQTRLKVLDEFVAYLDASNKGKLNDEAVVRMVPQTTLRQQSSWEDHLIPPDILASIVRKTFPHLRPLRTIAEVSGGLRTGANEVFAPDTHAIADEDLELQYWQRSGENGSIRDNIILTSAEDADTMLGLPNSDRRLLLLPAERAALAGTNVLTRIERAEREGIHLRPSVRHRDVWWSLTSPSIANIIIAKNQQKRWLVCANPVQAYITDAFIGVSLEDATLADQLVLWMNSSLGLFLTELVRAEENVVDITVRDAQEFPVPTAEILQAIETRKHHHLAKRPIQPLAQEFGSATADGVRQDTIQRDRRKIDSWLMTDVFGLTDEEQRWVYRFAFGWWNKPSNVRHLSNALSFELQRTAKVRPLGEWYAPFIEQLPEVAKRTIIVESGITQAEVDGTMFGWRVACKKGSRADSVIEVGSQEEAHIIALFVELGKLTIEVPCDPLFIADILPRLREFQQKVYTGVTELTEKLPSDLRAIVRQNVLRALT